MHNDKESPFTLTLVKGDLMLHVVQFSGHEWTGPYQTGHLHPVKLMPLPNA
ncbi:MULTISPECIES: hypothetical protein [unclassified Pseudomonas]|uniref:hypothetical protein n=1 Tax=unclassified Pseudomonas TaxID=196821 RepID=UPI002AC949F5|nr:MULTISPECIES: hypothetical protein [unclassified Pseudomonas]WPX60867.1 hypothetical protein RHM68_09620 [Pseudomonas sp. DC1.2]